MQADMEIQSAAKLSIPHLRFETGTGARSALKRRLCSMSAWTSGALGERLDEIWLKSNSYPIGRVKLTQHQQASVFNHGFRGRGTDGHGWKTGLRELREFTRIKFAKDKKGITRFGLPLQGKIFCGIYRGRCPRLLWLRPLA